MPGLQHSVRIRDARDSTAALCKGGLVNKEAQSPCRNPPQHPPTTCKPAPTWRLCLVRLHLHRRQHQAAAVLGHHVLRDQRRQAHRLAPQGLKAEHRRRRNVWHGHRLKEARKGRGGCSRHQARAARGGHSRQHWSLQSEQLRRWPAGGWGARLCGLRGKDEGWDRGCWRRLQDAHSGGRHHAAGLASGCAAPPVRLGLQVLQADKACSLSAWFRRQLASTRELLQLLPQAGRLGAASRRALKQQHIQQRWRRRCCSCWLRALLQQAAQQAKGRAAGRRLVGRARGLQRLRAPAVLLQGQIQRAGGWQRSSATKGSSTTVAALASRSGGSSAGRSSRCTPHSRTMVAARGACTHKPAGRGLSETWAVACTASSTHKLPPVPCPQQPHWAGMGHPGCWRRAEPTHP